MRGVSRGIDVVGDGDGTCAATARSGCCSGNGEASVSDGD